MVLAPALQVGLQMRVQKQILAPQINNAFAGADGVGAQGHSAQQGIGMFLH